MAYSPIEQAYIDGIVSAQFPDPEPQPEPVMLADSGQVKSDAGQDYGSIGPIKRNKAQEALGYVGELLTKAGVQLDKVGLDVPVLGRITLKDLTVGESGKVLEDMSYGFMPVEGAGGFISGTTRIKPDAALELMNIAPTVGAVAKMGGKSVVKGVTKAVKATEGLPVGLSVKEVGKGVDDLGFYSAASKAVDAIQQPKGTGDQFLKQIEKTPGVKPDEIKWTGLDDFLKGKKSVTKQEVQDYMAANRVEVKEVQIKDPTESDIQAFLDDEMGQGYTRQEAIDYLRNDEGATKFSKYTLPGGENYREVLLTLPSKNQFDPSKVEITRNRQSTTQGSYTIKYDNKEVGTFSDELKSSNNYKGYSDEQIMNHAKSLYEKGSPYSGIKPISTDFKSQHFDEPNVLAHLRVNDRVDVDGKKVLFVEEVQSDWHQAGRKKGYNDPNALSEIQKQREALLAEKQKYSDLAMPYVSQGKDAPQEIIDGYVKADDRLNALQTKQNRLGQTVPDAPFKTNWQELAMKRAIQMAAEGGYDRIAFTTGKTQAARYDLSKQIENIQYNPNNNNLFAEDKFGKIVIDEKVDPKDLPDVIGKDVAEKLLKDESVIARRNDGHIHLYELSGQDLQVGGEGMAGFYDNILPKFLDKYAKKWDAKTGMTEVQVGKGKPTDYADFNEWQKAQETSGVPVHYIDITPKMKQSVVTEGQPLFAVGAGAGAGAAATKEENK